MIQKAIGIRKKYRYKPNIVILSGCQLLTVFFLCLLLAGYSRPGVTSFSIANYTKSTDYIECLIMIDQDTILHQSILPHTAFHLSEEIPKGKHVLQVSDLLTGITNVDTLLVRDQYRDEHVHIDYQPFAINGVIRKYPVENRFKIELYHSDFFNYLWE